MSPITAPIAPITVVKDDKEEERDEQHSASYDASASQSPSDTEDHRTEGRASSEDHIDVEETSNTPLETTTAAEAETSTETEKAEKAETSEDVEMSEEPVEKKPEVLKDDEAASHLLLNFSQQSFTNPSDEARIAFAPAPTAQETNSEPFIQSTLSAFSTPEQQQQQTANNNQSPTTETPTTSFCRPPGLGPALTPTGQNVLVCPICGFSCNSKFHYNSHMNTHGDHQCSMCDYTSRTEGRLKKHMKESHTAEEQLAAGMEIEPKSPSSVPKADTSSLSSTMATLVDAATAVANGNVEQAATSLAAVMSGETGLTSPLNTTAPLLLPSALDQIKAFTEKNPLLPEAGINIANALSAMNQLNEENRELMNRSNSEPRRNSNGKIKQLKCKQCPHVSLSKNDQWAHARTHIPNEKQMNCPQCNFVTEYKHHLEYHIRNHMGSKPFQCKKCNYTCVNKSMLNSHMKSHTNIYQFRCMDCTYATKYCHSLKLHLKKYDHRRVPDGDNGDSPPSQLKPDGLPFNLGGFTPTRPPPPATTLAQTLALSAPIVTSQSLNYASQMLLRQHQMDPMNIMGLTFQQPTLKCALCDYNCNTQEDLMRHNMTHIMGTAGASPIVSLYQSLPQMSGLLPLQGLADASSLAAAAAAMDTTENESGTAGDDEMEGSSGSTGSPGGSSEDSRKKKGFKVDQIGERLLCDKSGSECGSPIDMKPDVGHIESSVSPDPMIPITPTSIAQSVAAFAQLNGDPNMSLFRKACLAQLTSMVTSTAQDEAWRFQCSHCKMAFQDQALYHVHMGYHGYEHAFKCNRCGYVAPDSLTFNLHLLQASHE